jgi:hypothetical protein
MLLMLEDSAERLERFAATVREIDPELQLRSWPDAHAMIREIGPLLESTTLVSLDDHFESEPVASDPGGGLAVAEFLVSQPVVVSVIIHSSNSERSRRMADQFDLAGWPYWRVAPLGDGWIESDWRAAVQQILTFEARMRPVAGLTLTVREQAYLSLLHWGLPRLRDSACGGQIDLCHIEADHLHNIPSLFGETNEHRHLYYIEQERGLYLERLVKLGATEYLEEAKQLYSGSWKALAAAAGVRLPE